MKGTLKRLAASTMLGLAMLAGGAQQALAEIWEVYECRLAAVLIPIDGDGQLGDPIGIYRCSLVAIIITAD